MTTAPAVVENPVVVPYNPAPVITVGEAPPTPEPTSGPLTAAEASALIVKEIG